MPSLYEIYVAAANYAGDLVDVESTAHEAGLRAVAGACWDLGAQMRHQYIPGDNGLRNPYGPPADYDRGEEVDLALMRRDMLVQVSQPRICGADLDEVDGEIARARSYIRRTLASDPTQRET